MVAAGSQLRTHVGLTARSDADIPHVSCEIRLRDMVNVLDAVSFVVAEAVAFAVKTGVGKSLNIEDVDRT